MVAQTLVLNRDWRPIGVVPAIRAIVKVFKGKAQFIHPETFCAYSWENWIVEWEDAIKMAKVETEHIVSMAGFSMVVPEVIVCSTYRGTGYSTNQNPKFNRRNLMLRDRCRCQFCGKTFKSEDLTMDHVIPKSKGGQAVWTNIVCACLKCNHKKADKSLEKSGLKLIRMPFAPTAKDLSISPLARLKLGIRSQMPKTWQDIIGEMYWSVALQTE